MLHCSTRVKELGYVALQYAIKGVGLVLHCSTRVKELG
jgi:hypothetical protein